MPCACGCGEGVNPDSRGRPRRFVPGHQGRAGGRRAQTSDQRLAGILDRILCGDDCWAWDGAHRKEDGRPTFRRKYAYVLVYETLVGPVPVGKILHHTCENRWCVRPSHLSPITQGEHIAEHGLPGDNHQSSKGECPRGHQYDEENTYVYVRPDGGVERHCKKCRRAAKARYRARGRSVA